MHLESRLNRKEKVADNLDLTNLIYGANENFSAVYHEFLERLRLLEHPRINAQALNELNQIGRENLERNNNEERNETNGNRVQETDNRNLQISNDNTNSTSGQNTSQAQGLQSQNIIFQDSAIIESQRSVRGGETQATQSSSQFDSLALLAQM